MSDPTLSCFCALALELTPGAAAPRTTLSQAQAGALADRIAQDLARIAPDVQTLDLAVLGAHFDPVELLRPGWPLHAALGELAARAPRADRSGHVIAFGSHAGALPATALTPATDLDGGMLRLLPLVLRGDAASVNGVAAHFEDVLFDTGLASAEASLLAQELFGATLEHARYLTLYDLCAMTAMQYEHAGLAPLWPLIEAALLGPAGGEHWLDAPPEPLARCVDAQVRIALLDAEAWLDAGFAGAATESDKLAHGFEQFQTRQRQFAAVLGAHGIAVTFDHCPAGTDPRGVLRA